MRESSPLPWKAQVFRYPNGQLHGKPSIYAPNAPVGGRHVCELYDNGALDANAELIVRAVNCHADLIDALTDARHIVHGLHTFCQPQAGGEDKISRCLAKIDMALAKAKGATDERH